MSQVQFKELKVGDRFMHDGKEFERIKGYKKSCCGPTLNCRRIDNGKDHVITKDIKVERILQDG